MTVKFMPFWFADVVKSEEKLSRLASEGLMLTGFKPYGLFTFEQGEAEQVRYRIVREKKCEGKVPKRFTENGWVKCADSKHYYIIKNADKETEAEPSYKSWVTLYRTLQTVMFFIICFVVGMFIGAGAATLEDIATKEIRWQALIVPLVLSAIFILIWRKLHKSNKKVLAKNPDAVKFAFTIPEENFIYTKEQEKGMLKSKEMIKKSPFFWIAAPDKAEAMVEKMAAEGWKFYRFDKLGQDFYFIKSEPCKLRFIVDFQAEISEEYIALTKENGWKLEFASVTKKDGYCIWSREYADDEEIPELYSDNESALNHAKNYLKKMIIPLTVDVILAVLLIIWCFTDDLGMTPFKIGYVIFMAVIALEYGFFAIKSVGYYSRLRKKND
ncbi:MAG: DUF2812 domain-containing protein [Oscillospiraceae bacterium]|nr:DUF2812 domain-containing protein [Oscillospiraceae bacterium]